MSPLSLLLVAPQPALCDAFRRHFSGLRNVTVEHGTFEALSTFDCLVSPANSFGLMDGGADAAIAKMFGPLFVREVQRRILVEYLGEQPVGTSVLVETGHPKHPYVAHTPTMRVPMPIAHTDNVYRAMWAMLLAVHAHNQSHTRRIDTVAVPGMGTGAGRVPFAEAARQMALAYRHFLAPPTSLDWDFATARQEVIRYGGDLGLEWPPEGDPAAESSG